MIKKLYYKFIYSHYIDQFLNWFVWKFNNPYKLEMPCGWCPVQIEGNLLSGEYYYFRGRGNKWSIELYENEGDFFARTYLQKRLFQYSEKFGETFEAGWMLKREAIKFATLGIDKYYETKLFNAKDGL